MQESTDIQGGYDPSKIEEKWQKYWLEHKTFATPETSSKPKYYILDMFPYPSGAGLHVGHPEGYTATDILARFKRMNGFNVLHPMGWDAFGLPAEQYAVKTGTHPRKTTDSNINHFRKQIQSLGLSYDWDREVDTTSVDYYKWTQWIFLQLYNKGLAYESSAPVNWCPELGTVLANEEVIDGKSEVGGFPVIKKPMRQWVFKITEYAERLLNDLDDLDWPESIKTQQRNWIGKSIGAEVSFHTEHNDHQLKVFTTRPDTLFGATFMVLAPEHELVEKLTTDEKNTVVEKYVEETLAKSERDRISSTEKSGVFIGSYAINPVNNEKIPIYISDYVLASYGTGAIMAVPAHDQRDFEFAQKFGIPIKQVLESDDADITKQAYTGSGTLINSEFLNGLTKEEAISKTISWLESKNLGKSQTTYKLRDWLFSRQRYWGEPIPILRDKDGNHTAVDESELPIVLPDLEDFKPAGNAESPLARATDWLKVEKDGQVYTRETNTMPQWAGSCWYYLRFIDPKNIEAAWDNEKEKYWMPVDLYIGGAEHAVLHLLYARFWHKVLYDLGYVSTKEPFKRLVNQGMILGENGEKMSKSRGNVVNPDDVVAEWGADSMRLYEMFMGPLTATKPWQTNGISGVNRFLKKAWRLAIDEETGNLSSKVTDSPDSPEITKQLHKTIKKVTQDIEDLNFNTAISAMMEFLNAAQKAPSINKSSVETLVLLLAPYAPHLAEELWEKLGHTSTLAYEAWPKYDKALTEDDSVTISIQVNGKLRGTIEASKSSDKDQLLSDAKEIENIRNHLDGKSIKKEIYVPGKIINFVVK